jgi:hypothetical protein
LLKSIFRPSTISHNPPPPPTTTASLQQEDNDNETAAAVNATTDEPFIPIGLTEEGSPKVIQLQYLSSFFFTFQV